MVVRKWFVRKKKFDLATTHNGNKKKTTKKKTPFATILSQMWPLIIDFKPLLVTDLLCNFLEHGDIHFFSSHNEKCLMWSHNEKCP